MINNRITQSFIFALAVAVLLCLEGARAQSQDQESVGAGSSTSALRPGLTRQVKHADHSIDADDIDVVQDGDDDDDDGDGGGGFARKVAGTYVDQGEFLDGLITFVGTVTVGRDGTIIATNSNCCGSDTPDANTGGTNLQSPGHGNWARTGPRQITATAITFVQTFLPDEEECPLGCPDAVLAARPNLVVDFAPDYQSAEAIFMTDIFLLDQDFDGDGILDYLDPDGVPLVTIPGTDQWTRLPITQ